MLDCRLLSSSAALSSFLPHLCHGVGSTDVAIVPSLNHLAYVHQSILCYRIEADTSTLLAMKRTKRQSAIKAEALVRQVAQVEQDKNLAETQAKHDEMDLDEPADDADSELQSDSRPIKKSMFPFVESILGALTGHVERSPKQTHSEPENNAFGDPSVSNAKGNDDCKSISSLHAAYANMTTKLARLAAVPTPMSSILMTSGATKQTTKHLKNPRRRML